MIYRFPSSAPSHFTVPLSIMTMVKTLGVDKNGLRPEVVRLLRWSGIKVMLYILLTFTHGIHMES